MKRIIKVCFSFVVGTIMAVSLTLTVAAAEGSDISSSPSASSNSATLNTSMNGICTLPKAKSRKSSLAALVVPSIEVPSARAAYIQVKVCSPCDEQWRAIYPNTWMAEANNAVEIADTMLADWFNIDFRSVAQSAWTSPDGSAGEILNSASDDVGLKNGAQIMIACSGRVTDYGGVAYMNTRYCVIFDQGTEYNGYSARHEVGHLYGCPDEYDTATLQFTSKECLMNNSYDYNDIICESCYSIWDGNKNSK